MTPGNGFEGITTDNDGSRVRVTRRYVLIATAVLGGIVLLLGLWITIDVLRVRAALNDAKDQASDLAEQIETVGPGGEAAIAGQLGRDVTKARRITDGPMWSLGKHLPVFGEDFRVVAEATDAIEEVATVGVPGLTQLATERDNGQLAVKDGRVDLSVIRRLTPVMEDSNKIFTAGRERFAEIDVDRAHGPVQSSLATVQARLDQAQDLISKGTEALRLAPGMLGSSGPRTYLLIFQNNAEIRSTGGIPGAYAELRAVDGALQIKRQGEGSSTGIFNPPAVKITAEEKALYGTLPGNYWVDANFSPHFPRTAEILRAMYQKRFKTRLDGIISVDPVALARILRATGPVQVTKDVALSSENVINVLLNAVYTAYPEDDDAQNEFFSKVARKIFETFISGQADSGELIAELQASTQEGRIIVNASNSKEQSLFEGTRLAGELPADDGATPHLGLYLNDSSASKLEFYLRRNTEVKAVACEPNKVQVFELTTSLKSVAPKDVTDLGPGVVGFTAGAKKGHISMVLSYYAPYGGTVTGMTVDGKERSVNKRTYRGLTLATVPVDLAPGGSQTLTVTVRSGPGQQKDGVFRTTPGVEVTPNNVPVPSAC